MSDLQNKVDVIRSEIMSAKPNLRLACKMDGVHISHPLELRALGRALAVLAQKPEKLTRGNHVGYRDHQGNQRFLIHKLIDLVPGTRYLWSWKDQLMLTGELPAEWAGNEATVYGLVVVRPDGVIEISREFSEEKHRKWWELQGALVDPSLFKSPTARLTKDVIVCRVLAGEKFNFDRKSEVAVTIVNTFYRDELRTLAGLAYNPKDSANGS